MTTPTLVEIRTANAAVTAALEAFDDRCRFLWSYADVELDHFAYLPDDGNDRVTTDQGRLAEHYRKYRAFVGGFADRFDDARRTLMEAVNAAIATAPPSDDQDRRRNDAAQRHWSNDVAEFSIFDHDMKARWKALEIVCEHYNAHPPEEPAELVAHHRELITILFDFVHATERERKELDAERQMLAAAE